MWANRMRARRIIWVRSGTVLAGNWETDTRVASCRGSVGQRGRDAAGSGTIFAGYAEPRE